MMEMPSVILAEVITVPGTVVFSNLVMVGAVGGGVVTVRVAVPVLPERAAEIVEEPAATPVAKPELLIVALERSELLQATEEVITPVEPSE
jgi:hypothetical protein